MLTVPLRGDKIETHDGVEFTVLSYTNYRERGPAVYVEHTPSVPSDAVYFFDVNRINGKAVEYVASSKVFKVYGELQRKYQLPQIGDKVTFKSEDGPQTLKVTGLKLHKKGELSKGLLVQVQLDDSEEKLYLRLEQILDLERDIGNDLFSKDRFLTYYSEYKGSR